MKTETDLVELRAMHARATSGPWAARKLRNEWRLMRPVSTGAITEHDATLIVAMHTELPKLLDRIEQGEALAIDPSVFEQGAWSSCTGCHELNEGHATGPYSAQMRCNLGVGCHECGGIGAIWEIA